MIPKAAIEKAIEGGWKSVCSNCQESWLGHKQTRIGNRYCTTGPAPYKTALDPSFWVALGKALGWKRFAIIQWYDNFGSKKEREIYRGVESWLFQARRFSSIVLTGGDTEAFWKELLVESPTS